MSCKYTHQNIDMSDLQQRQLDRIEEVQDDIREQVREISPTSSYNITMIVLQCATIVLLIVMGIIALQKIQASASKFDNVLQMINTVSDKAKNSFFEKLRDPALRKDLLNLLRNEKK